MVQQSPQLKATLKTISKPQLHNCTSLQPCSWTLGLSTIPSCLCSSLPLVNQILMSSAQDKIGMPTCLIVAASQKDLPQTKASNFQANFPNNTIISAEQLAEKHKKGSEHKVTKGKQQMVLHNWQNGKSKGKNPFMKGAKMLQIKVSV